MSQHLFSLCSVAPFAQYSFNVTGQTSAGLGPTSPSVPFATPQGSEYICFVCLSMSVCLSFCLSVCFC